MSKTDPELHFGYLVGESDAMQTVYSEMEKIIPTELNVVIRGETGTGKELVSRAIHENGPRSDGPFESMNCARYDGSLLESELFGHKEGAFTGATEDRAGFLERADGGTLLLDEIAEMSEDMQTKLLRALEEEEIRRVGGEKTRKANVRIICATPISLTELVEDGEFRRDLYYRLREAVLRLPPLRKRKEDIPLLANYFLSQISEEKNLSEKEISKETMKQLKFRSWKGNVRHLQNTIHQMALFSGERRVIKMDDKQTTTIIEETRRKSETSQRTLSQEEKKWNQLLRSEKIERVKKVVEEMGGNKSEAAKKLGISRNTLYRYLDSDEESNV